MNALSDFLLSPVPLWPNLGVSILISYTIFGVFLWCRYGLDSVAKTAITIFGGFFSLSALLLGCFTNFKIVLFLILVIFLSLLLSALYTAFFNK